MVSSSESEERGGTDYTYHADAQGSTRGISAGGAVTDAVLYDAFGNTISRSGSTPTPVLYNGAAGYQSDSATGLQLLGHRYYDPSIGRFLSSDPAQAGTNWYAYCDNNPLIHSDRTGLEYPGEMDDDGLEGDCKFIEEPSLLIEGARVSNNKSSNGNNGGNNSGNSGGNTGLVNRKGEPHPRLVHPITGDDIDLPDPMPTEKIPNEYRELWTDKDLKCYKIEWAGQGNPDPPGGWGNYDVHHIIPRAYGGTNDYNNLIPVLRSYHQQVLNPWWNSYGGGGGGGVQEA